MVFPLVTKKKFHFLFGYDGEDDVHWIASTLIDLIVHSAPTNTKHTKHAYVVRFRALIWKIIKEISHFEMTVLHNMENSILRGMFK